MSAPFTEFFPWFGLALYAAFWSYVSGRIKRHEIGLPLAFIPLILILWVNGIARSDQRAGYPIISGLPITMLYSIHAVIGYYLGFHYNPPSMIEEPS